MIQSGWRKDKRLLECKFVRFAKKKISVQRQRKNVPNMTQNNRARIGTASQGFYFLTWKK